MTTHERQIDPIASAIAKAIERRYGTAFSGCDAWAAMVHSHMDALARWEQQFVAELRAEDISDPRDKGNAACACSTLEARCRCPNLGDVSRADWIGKFLHMLIFGSPCQSWSTSGEMLGRIDPRAWLSVDALQLAGRCRAQIVVMENVVALPKYFPEFFSELIRIFRDMGYAVGWAELDPRMFGVPAKRPRMYLVAASGLDGEEIVRNIFADWPQMQEIEPAKVKWADYIESADRLCHIDSKTNKPRWHEFALKQDQAGLIINKEHRGNISSVVLEAFERARQTGYDVDGEVSDVSPDEMWFWDAEKDFGSSYAVMPTVMKSGRHSRGCFMKIDGALYPRMLTAWEAERFQGFPGDWTDVPHQRHPGRRLSESQRYKLLGNSMSIDCLRFLFDRINRVMEGRWNP